MDLETLGLHPTDPADISENPIKMFSRDWALVAAGSPQGFNALTVAWGALGTAWGNGLPLAIIFVSPDRFTHGFLEREQRFSINVLPGQYRKALGYIGSHSGRDGDKISASGLEYAFTDHSTPVFTQARLVLECGKIYSHSLDSRHFGEVLQNVYEGHLKGLTPHTVYYGEILGCWKRAD